jgi:hypothetical protein
MSEGKTSQSQTLQHRLQVQGILGLAMILVYHLLYLCKTLRDTLYIVVVIETI